MVADAVLRIDPKLNVFLGVRGRRAARLDRRRTQRDDLPGKPDLDS
jgi:hypothetical protein